MREMFYKFSVITTLTIGSSFASETTKGSSVESLINNIFASINGQYAKFLFWEVPLIKLPLILFIMVTGGIYFTFRYGFLNLTMYKHAIHVVKGDYDHPDHEGEITHFQALTSALSATVGLGNIAGVAVAIYAGGPGAIFWLWLVAFFGMCMKFSSCTFAQLYRMKDSKGEMLGGPMVYLKEGLAERGHPFLGKLLGGFFAVMTILASFGGGNLFQANQTYEIIKMQFPAANALVVGLSLAFLSAIVLLGGIKRIASVTSKLVPFMCVFYVIACLAIIFANYEMIPNMFAQIFIQAFTPEAAYGGFIGVMIQGVKRASFSNEAGLGSAAIAHSAAKTDEPVREGLVAMIGPSIDTHLVCTMTALAILISGANTDPQWATDGGNLVGVKMTALAFSTLGSWMPYVLTLAIAIFAYSTVISWSYYGERATEYLFGNKLGGKAILIYKIIYVLIIIIGPLLSVQNVVDFADLMLLSMAFPNILGMMYMSKTVKDKVTDYVNRYKSGSMPKYTN